MRFVPTHSPGLILAECHRAGQTGIFLMRDHAFDRALERNLTRRDIRHALSGVGTVVFQEDEGTWLATGGVDAEGVEVGLAVVVTSGLIVVTVF